MRARMLVAALAALAALAGCSPGPDPLWGKPCGERGEPAVIVGTGQYEFDYVGSAGLPIETDLVNGDYMWLAIACRGLGPYVNVDFGIEDDETGAVISNTPETRLSLTYDSAVTSGNAPDRVEGLPAYFALGDGGIADVAQLVGRHVTFYANVADSCTGLDVRSETSVSGYNQLSCPGCLDGQCYSELADCTSECVALQACVDTWCSQLSKLSSPEEVTCQAWCEDSHPLGKVPLVRLAQCLQTTTCQQAPVDCDPTVTITCQPPCFGYSIDYRHCTNLLDLADAGPCAGTFAACAKPSPCDDYHGCITRCTSWVGCQACAPDCSAMCAGDGGASSACSDCKVKDSGRSAYEQHQLCLDDPCINHYSPPGTPGTCIQGCMAQGWLPHINSSDSSE